MSKKNSGLDYIEDPDLLANKLEQAEDFVEKNRNILIGAAVAVVAVIALFFGYRYYQSTRNGEGQAKLFAPVTKFEQDSLKLALNGTKQSPGLVAVADEYGSTKAGNLAHLYAGIALLKDGKYDQAIEQLKDFSSSDLLVQGRAYALIGDAYMEKKSYTDAVDYYKKAAEYKPNKFFTAGYLMKLALAHELAKDNKNAIDVYQQILDKYPNAAEAPNARKYKSVLDAQVGE